MTMRLISSTRKEGMGEVRVYTKGESAVRPTADEIESYISAADKQLGLWAYTGWADECRLILRKSLEVEA